MYAITITIFMKEKEENNSLRDLNAIPTVINTKSELLIEHFVPNHFYLR